MTEATIDTVMDHTDGDTVTTGDTTIAATDIGADMGTTDTVVRDTGVDTDITDIAATGITAGMGTIGTVARETGADMMGTTAIAATGIDAGMGTTAITVRGIGKGLDTTASAVTVSTMVVTTPVDTTLGLSVATAKGVTIGRQTAAPGMTDTAVTTQEAGGARPGNSALTHRAKQTANGTATTIAAPNNGNRPTGRGRFVWSGDSTGSARSKVRGRRRMPVIPIDARCTTSAIDSVNRATSRLCVSTHRPEAGEMVIQAS